MILPTAAGFACRYLADAAARRRRSESGSPSPARRRCCCLNYINSALALPKIRESPPSLLAATAVLAAALSVVGLVLRLG